MDDTCTNLTSPINANESTSEFKQKTYLSSLTSENTLKMNIAVSPGIKIIESEIQEES